MNAFIITMLVLTSINLILNIAMLGMGILPKPKTRGILAFSVFEGILIVGWISYILITGAK